MHIIFIVQVWNLLVDAYSQYENNYTHKHARATLEMCGTVVYQKIVQKIINYRI